MIEIKYVPVGIDTLKTNIWKDIHDIIAFVMDRFKKFVYSASLYDVEYTILELKLYVKFVLKQKE